MGTALSKQPRQIGVIQGDQCPHNPVQPKDDKGHVFTSLRKGRRKSGSLRHCTLIVKSNAFGQIPKEGCIFCLKKRSRNSAPCFYNKD